MQAEADAAARPGSRRPPRPCVPTLPSSPASSALVDRLRSARRRWPARQRRRPVSSPARRARSRAARARRATRAAAGTRRIARGRRRPAAGATASASRVRRRTPTARSATGSRSARRGTGGAPGPPVPAAVLRPLARVLHRQRRPPAPAPRAAHRVLRAASTCGRSADPPGSARFAPELRHPPVVVHRLELPEQAVAVAYQVCPRGIEERELLCVTEAEASICRMTLARLVRSISGGVKRGAPRTPPRSRGGCTPRGRCGRSVPRAGRRWPGRRARPAARGA